MFLPHVNGCFCVFCEPSALDVSFLHLSLLETALLLKPTLVIKPYTSAVYGFLLCVRFPLALVVQLLCVVLCFYNREIGYLGVCL